MFPWAAALGCKKVQIARFCDQQTLQALQIE
jgi:hypothetical protein